MTGQYEGKVVLVTGAALGIGKATARAFAREGARVVVADIFDEGGEETVRTIRAERGEATYIRCDISRAASVRALLDGVIGAYGQLDCAVNNAGVKGTRALTAEYPEGDWDEVLRVNLTGPWLCMKHEIPHMLQRGRGAIVNIASILGVVGYTHSAAYAAAKHGVVGLTKVAALEYATQDIRVNAICPGFVETLMGLPPQQRLHMKPLPPDVPKTANYQRIAKLHALNRMGQPEEIAAAALWLCSDAASFVTGHIMMVDGGYSAQ